MTDFQPVVVTQRDIARKLGVSNATVSLALRDNPRITEARRREIQAFALEMGYCPNPAAATLSYQKRNSKTIPIHSSLAWLNLWPKPEELRYSPVFDCYWRGAEASAEKFGYRLDEITLARITPHNIEKILQARGIGAIVLSPQHFSHRVDLQDIHWEKFCAIRTSRLPLKPALHLVTTDQSGNTMLAFDRILAKGYKRVGFIGYYRPPVERIWCFESGYLMVQQELPESDRLPIYRLQDSDPASRTGLGEWMKQQRPDAVLTINANAREILESLGYRAPDDIGLATLNTQDCKIEAGIDQNAMEVGRSAVLQLLSMVHDNDHGIPSDCRETLIRGRWLDGPSLPNRA